MTKQSRTNKNKILELLKENPNLQRACKKAGFARSTVYRWMEEDIDFRDDVRNAQEIGYDTMNDYVEAKLMENIQTNNQRSIEFYLRHNNQRYASTRVETEYFDKRGVGRVGMMPYGVDGMYYTGEIQMYDKATELMQLRQMIDDVKSETRDPDEPVPPEALSKDFAREFYAAFPDAKEKIDAQMKEYTLKKIAEKLEEHDNQ